MKNTLEMRKQILSVCLLLFTLVGQVAAIIALLIFVNKMWVLFVCFMLACSATITIAGIYQFVGQYRKLKKIQSRNVN